MEKADEGGFGAEEVERRGPSLERIAEERGERRGRRRRALEVESSLQRVPGGLGAPRVEGGKLGAKRRRRSNDDDVADRRVGEEGDPGGLETGEALLAAREAVAVFEERRAQIAEIVRAEAGARSATAAQ